MSRLRHADILVELIELVHEVMNEVRQQLAYYRASVYKDETASGIHLKIDQLRLVTGLTGDDMASEPLKDYDAMCKGGVADYIPGECAFSRRVTCLLTSLEAQMDRLGRGVQFQQNQGVGSQDGDFARQIQKHRRQLLALCRHGSRQWAFFQSL